MVRQRKPQTEVGKILGFDPPEVLATLPTKSGKARKPRPPKPPPVVEHPPLPTLPCRILGLDPGFAIFGFAVLDVFADRIEAEEYGVVVTTTNTSYPKRLATILGDFESLILKYEPKLMVLEMFFSGNMGTNTVAVAQARGLLVALAGKYNLPLYEPEPNLVKMKVHGSAKADKKEMQEAVSRELGLDYLIYPDDAADAIGNGLTGAWGLQQGNLDLLMLPKPKKARTRAAFPRGAKGRGTKSRDADPMSARVAGLDD